MISIEVGSNHFHAACVDKALNATFHARFDHILRSWDDRKKKTFNIKNWFSVSCESTRVKLDALKRKLNFPLALK